jgi:endo-1,4-beta-xylanase
MKQLRVLLAFASFFLLCSMLPGAGPNEILLWPNGAPGSEGKTGDESLRITPEGDHVITHINKPSITTYLAAPDKNTGTAIIVVPGGGHSELWISHEGYNPAQWFQQRGINAFVLKYRLAREPNSTYTVDKDELADIQRAIRMVRNHAKQWNIDTAKLGVMGFSAGGELSALAAMHYSPADKNAADPIDREDDRPDFQALIYPGNIPRLTVSKASPPVFIAGGFKDRSDISEGVAQLYLKYKEAGVPAELHIYANVGHGFGIRATNKGTYTEWPRQVELWLEDMGFLKEK